QIGNNAHEIGHRTRDPRPETPASGGLGVHDCRTVCAPFGEAPGAVAGAAGRADPLDALLLFESDRRTADTRAGYRGSAQAGLRDRAEKTRSAAAFLGPSGSPAMGRGGERLAVHG